jgi:hypothetical protein
MRRKFHHAIAGPHPEAADKADFVFGFGPMAGTPHGYLPRHPE